MEIFLTTAQVAEKLQVSERTVLRWIEAKELVAAKLGRVWRIKESDFDNFLRERTNISK